MADLPQRDIQYALPPYLLLVLFASICRISLGGLPLLTPVCLLQQKVMRAYQGPAPIGGGPQGFRGELPRCRNREMSHFWPPQAPPPPRKRETCLIFVSGNGD